MSIVPGLPELPAETPAVVYFWGPVRSHVNRVAAEYARRLQSDPVWLDVRDPSANAEPPPSLDQRFVRSVYRLRAGTDVQLTPPSFAVPVGNDGSPPAVGDLDGEAGSVLTFPPVVHTALAAASRSVRPGAFLLSNIDRLQHLSPMFGRGRAERLFQAFQQRGIVLILTSEGLLPLPRLPLECAFEVNSSPEDAWYEAEVRPGVPVSCCATCSGSVRGGYATCSPTFQSACPVLVPFAETTALA